MAIYMTGDVHGGIDIHKLTVSNWAAQKKLTRDDYLVITGDFGFPFAPSELEKNGEGSGTYRYWVKWLKEKPFTILFVDGNHENHAFWDAQPVKDWHGGKVHVHPDAPNIIHLMRGEIYDIDGKSVFAFGGAASHDVEPVYEDGKCIWKGRTEGVDWWEREVASEEEMNHAKENLRRHGNQVDVILTHTPPMGVVKTFLRNEKEARKDPVAEFLEEIQQNTSYGIWFSGHVHSDFYDIERRVCVLYKTVEEFDELEHRAAVITEMFSKARESRKLRSDIPDYAYV